MIPPSIGFHAMPDSPHLTHTHCGYTRLSLKDLSITADQVSSVFINGVIQNWRPLWDQTLLIIPAFAQEAQRIVIELKVPAGNTAPETFKPLRATLPPPKESWGFTPPETRREAAP